MITTFLPFWDHGKSGDTESWDRGIMLGWNPRFCISFIWKLLSQKSCHRKLYRVWSSSVAWLSIGTKFIICWTNETTSLWSLGGDFSTSNPPSPPLEETFGKNRPSDIIGFFGLSLLALDSCRTPNSPAFFCIIRMTWGLKEWWGRQSWRDEIVERQI